MERDREEQQGGSALLNSPAIRTHCRAVLQHFSFTNCELCRRVFLAVWL